RVARQETAVAKSQSVLLAKFGQGTSNRVDQRARPAGRAATGHLRHHGKTPGRVGEPEGLAERVLIGEAREGVVDRSTVYDDLTGPFAQLDPGDGRLSSAGRVRVSSLGRGNRQFIAPPS